LDEWIASGVLGCRFAYDAGRSGGSIVDFCVLFCKKKKKKKKIAFSTINLLLNITPACE
jgi:hypothetical protein